MARLDGPGVMIITMELPAFIWGSRDAPLKVLRLGYWSRRIRNADLIVTLERTSTILKRIPGRCPPLIHIPHGAGDRAKGFEQRLRRFDHIIVAGAKDKRRMIADALGSDASISVSGSIKLSGVRRINRANQPALFRNDLPVVLYNPHFDDRLSSFAVHGRTIIETILATGRFNLIFAPHMRLFEGAGAANRADYYAYAKSDRCIVDLGSVRSVDMSYTDAADIYVGDVSSQIYEFLTRPRACIFVNSHQVDWAGDPDYAMWQFGDVIADPVKLIETLDAAPAQHHLYADRQREAVADALGIDTSPGEDAADYAARIILSLLPTSAR